MNIFLLNLLARAAEFFAWMGAGAASALNNYQPTLPRQFIDKVDKK